MQEPLEDFMSWQGVNNGSTSDLKPFESALEVILSDIRARVDLWFAEFKEAAAEHNENRRLLEAERPQQTRKSSGCSCLLM